MLLDRDTRGSCGGKHMARPVGKWFEIDALISTGITALTPATPQFNNLSTERTGLWLSCRKACGCESQ
jgi:hypothetical protein